MGDEFIPDYSKYSSFDLIDIYNRIDKVNNPKRTKVIEDELRRKLNIDSILSFNDDIVKQKLKNIISNDKFEKEELPKYEKKIKRGWIAGIVLGTIILLLTIIALKSPGDSFLRNNFNDFSLIDIIIIYSLSYGIYKKNKIASILLLAYVLLPKLLVLIDTGDIKALSGGSIFLYFFFEATRGIFDYHKNRSETDIKINAV